MACFDIGSNAVRYLIAEWADEKLIERFIGGEITGASDAVNERGEINFDGLIPTVMALNRFVRLAVEADATPVCALATAVFRDAKNADQIISQLEGSTGIPIIPLSQPAEACLGFIGAISGMSFIDRSSLPSIAFADVGGRSTELVIGDAAGSLYSVHGLNIGSRELTRKFITAYPIPDSERLRLHSLIRATLSPYAEVMREASHMIVSGGTAVALAMLVHNKLSFSTEAVHGTVLTKAYLTSTLERLSGMSLADCEALLAFEPKRASVFYAGVAIITSLLEIGGFERAFVSARCLMHGALEKLMRSRVNITSRDELARVLNEVQINRRA